MENKEQVFSIWKIFKSVSGLALLWNLVLILGGLVLLAFVVNNGFLPELDFSGAVSLLASVSLVSLFLVFAIFMLTTAGGWVMCSCFGKWDAKRRGQTSMLLAMLSATAVYVAFGIFGDAPRLVLNSAVGVLIVMTIWCLVTGGRRYRAGRSAWPRQAFGKEVGLAVGGLVIGTLFAFYNATVFLRLYRVQPGIDDIAEWGRFSTWLFAQAVCMGLVAFCSTLTTRLKMSGTLGAVGFVYLLILSNNPTFVMDRMAKALGIGALHDVSLAVTREGCQVLSVLSDSFLCTPVLDKSVYVIEPVTLRSRFGKQVLIEYTGRRDESGDSKEMVFEAVVQATEVLGWQRRGAASKSAKQRAAAGT